MKKFLVALILILLFVTGATVVTATCIPAKTFANFNTIEDPGAYFYIRFNDPTITELNMLGRFWQTSNRGTANEGAYDNTNWLVDSYYYPNTDSWYLNGNLASAGVNGCPATSLTVMVEDQKNGKFVAMAILEDVGRSVDFDFSKGGMDTPTVPIPRPRLTNLMRQGLDVVFDLSVDDASAGVYNFDTVGGAEITSVVIYEAVNPVSLDITIGGWTMIGSTTNGGSVSGLAADCSDTANNTSVAAGVEINGIAPMTVGQATLIECSTNLADPHPGVQIPESPSKPGRGKPRRK
jgi:hypothetical protein